MSVKDDIEAILNEPPPVRRYVIGWPRYAAFYKVGQSWIIHLNLPSGIIHLGHCKWWEPFRLLPKAVRKHYRATRLRS